MKLVNHYTVKQMIPAERDKIPFTVSASPYEFVKEKPYRHGDAMRGGSRIALRSLETTSAVDAVEVVRCKDCKWVYNEPDDYCCRCHKGLVKITPDSFCCYGERKTK